MRNNHLRQAKALEKEVEKQGNNDEEEIKACMQVRE